MSIDKFYLLDFALLLSNSPRKYVLLRFTNMSLVIYNLYYDVCSLEEISKNTVTILMKICFGLIITEGYSKLISYYRYS